MTQTVAASSVGFPQSLFSDRHQGPGARGSKGRNALTWSMVLLPENVASQHGYKMSISAALISQGGADPRNVLAAGATDNVHHGWGKSKELISSSDYTQMEKAGYAADLFYVLIIGLSKIGTMLFYQNLSLQRTKWMVNVIISSCGLWAMLAILLLAIRCSKRPWTDIDDACAGLYPRWQAICALDIVLEAVILAYPAITIRNVQISMSKKLKVLSILNCRIILIPLSAVHLYYIHSQIYSSNPSLAGTYATMVAELHLSLSIVLLTVSCLKMFVAVYEDDHGFAYTEDASNSQSRSGRTPQKSWRSSRPVKDLGSFGSSCIEEEPILRTEATASASSPPLEGHQSNAILKSVQISVTRESIELGEIAGPSSAAIPRPT
ncbi:hypothetical protein AtubIFM55763_008171 [Aspergillus tubingensis]|nr:hypothetical protein AtubIFM55763_008171 [Aspergillus tubingensis]GLA94375.1 hypothetical protein AtubIFM57143_001358 [Aspergillus tubingensis]